MRNLSGPNTARDSSVAPRPVSAGIRLPSLTHCSTKEVRKSAVMLNSIPSVEKGRTAPSKLSRMLPITQ